MPEEKPGILVYRHTRRGDFCIQRLTIDQEGFTTWAGDLVLVSKQEMSRIGLAVVRSCLAEFGKLDAADASELMRLAPRERSRFISEHASVGIDLEDDRTLSFNRVASASVRDRDSAWVVVFAPDYGNEDNDPIRVRLDRRSGASAASPGRVAPAA